MWSKIPSLCHTDLAICSILSSLALETAEPKGNGIYTISPYFIHIMLDSTFFSALMHIITGWHPLIWAFLFFEVVKPAVDNNSHPIFHVKFFFAHESFDWPIYIIKHITLYYSKIFFPLHPLIYSTFKLYAGVIIYCFCDYSCCFILNSLFQYNLIY